MDHKLFRIRWKDGDLLYRPAAGQIYNLRTKERIAVSDRPASEFPALRENGQWSFNPFCLTLYLGNKCNLNCAYCYIPEKERLPAIHFDLQALRSAAKVVARNSRRYNKPFILGFHGGNEPLLHLQTIRQCMDICKETAHQFGLPLQAYCTTNGVVSEKTAVWAARAFHGITLSWDGPDELHDQFRPKLNGKGTAADVRRTVSVLTAPENGLSHLRIRATVTSKSVEKLLDIVQYFGQHHIKQADLCPVYQNLGGSVSPEVIPDKILFLKNFLKARKWARKNGMSLTYANTRLGEFHDKHCTIFQNNLTITPDGYFTSCFQTTHNHHSHHGQYMFGKYRKSAEKTVLEEGKLLSIYRKVATPYDQCKDCFNYYHCSKGCPEICPVAGTHAPAAPFDCRVERWMSLANIIEWAGYEIRESEIRYCEDFFSGLEVKLVEA